MDRRPKEDRKRTEAAEPEQDLIDGTASVPV